MAEPVLSQRALNRAVLARQLLLTRARPPTGEVTAQALRDALEQVAGLQTQYAPSAYIGLWSRVEGFRREHLTTALHERHVVQATLMRATIHVVSAGDYPPLAAAVRRSRREWWRRTAAAQQLTEADFDRLAETVRSVLADGPRRRAELVAALEKAGFARSLWNGASLEVDLVRVPPSGTWERRRADLYALATDWLDPHEALKVDGPHAEAVERAALAHLVTRYLGGFGPASVADLVSWSGVPASRLQPALEELPLRRFRDEAGGELLDVVDGLLPDPDQPAPVRFLPTWDATLLVHARRAGILREEHRPLVFSTRNPHSTPTFLVDGTVAGTWRMEDGRVRLEPFGDLRPADRAALEEEAEALADFHR